MSNEGGRNGDIMVSTDPLLDVILLNYPLKEGISPLYLSIKPILSRPVKTINQFFTSMVLSSS